MNLVAPRVPRLLCMEGTSEQLACSLSVFRAKRHSSGDPIDVEQWLARLRSWEVPDDWRSLVDDPHAPTLQFPGELCSQVSDLCAGALAPGLSWARWRGRVCARGSVAARCGIVSY